ncbi:MAG TPA: ATP-binding cassette domain-containing protein, partial [Deltaproteobacteria bacterium]|nr:ATP-binding cassette domain-containing protein [Deltaproteobacteria bacterium]
TQIAQDEEIYEKTRINDERRRREIEEFIAQFRAKARLVGLVQSRIKLLGKLERKEKLEKIKSLEFSFRSTPFIAKYALQAKDLTFSYNPDTELIKEFSILIRPGDKVCVIGPNGKGKTTLLRLLAGQLRPQSGEVVYNPKAVRGVFEQTNIKTLVDSRTVEEEIAASASGLDRQAVRNICGAMMFEGDYALKRIGVLSGGEKSRVMLGKLLATPLNILLLDEPTNHLDMETSDALLAALDSFDGTVVMVTHNEMFLHALAERLIIFHHDVVEVFEGGYQRFLDKGGWGDEDLVQSVARKVAPAEHEDGRLTKKELRKKRSEIITERSRVIAPLETRIRQVEAGIEKHEQILKQLHKEIQQATLAKEGKRIFEISQSIMESEQAIEAYFSELEDLHASLERRQAEYDERLAEVSE